MVLFAGTAAAPAQTNDARSTNQTPGRAALTQPVAGTPTNAWKSSVSFGLTMARGNTDNTMASATASTEKRWYQNDLLFGGDGLYGETKTPGAPKYTENAETLHGFSQYNRFFGEDFYGYGRVDGFHDGIADIKYRLSLTPGLGYYFITNKTAELSAEIGPGYVKEQLGDESESFATLRLMEIFRYNLSPHAKAWETVKVLPQINEFDNYLIIAELGNEAGLTKGNRLSVRTVLQDNYNNIPAADRLKNDLKLISSLVYKF